MHCLLGAAALHLHRFSPDSLSYRVAESFHWHNAIRLYQGELASPIGPNNVDTLLSTCVMLCSSLLTVEGHDPTESWVFSSDPTALNWLMMQCGARYVLAQIAPYLEQSIWREVLMLSNDELQVLENHTPGREGLHSGLADLCGYNSGVIPGYGFGVLRSH